MGFTSPMQAIETKYFGPKARGSRIKATAQAGSVWMEYDDALSGDENHMEAARKLANKYGWLDNGRYYLVSGTLKNGNGCHVLVSTQILP